MHTPEEIKKALQDGIDAGKHDATPGNIFRTAWPAAEEHGYRKGTLRDVFTTGYLSELPSGGVLVDADGRTKAELDVPAANGYDYNHQAWVVNGHYIRCGHALAGKSCDCYGTIHKGEPVASDADIH